MKKTYLLFFTMLAFSCQLDNEEPELQEQEDQLIIVSASDEAKDLFDVWMGNSNPNARSTSLYNSRDLVQIHRSGMNRWAVPKADDPNTALSFVFDENRNIDKAFISTSVINRDNSITSKVFSTDNKLMMEFVYTPDGRREVVYRNQNIVHGFWSEWDKCLDTIGAPFPTNFQNNVFDFVANLSTVGMWTPAVHLVCLGVAGGLNYQNNQRK